MDRIAWDSNQTTSTSHFPFLCLSINSHPTSTYSTEFIQETTYLSYYFIRKSHQPPSSVFGLVRVSEWSSSRHWLLSPLVTGHILSTDPLSTFSHLPPLSHSTSNSLPSSSSSIQASVSLYHPLSLTPVRSLPYPCFKSLPLHATLARPSIKLEAVPNLYHSFLRSQTFPARVKPPIRKGIYLASSPGIMDSQVFQLPSPFKLPLNTLWLPLTLFFFSYHPISPPDLSPFVISLIFWEPHTSSPPWLVSYNLSVGSLPRLLLLLHQTRTFESQSRIMSSTNNTHAPNDTPLPGCAIKERLPACWGHRGVSLSSALSTFSMIFDFRLALIISDWLTGINLFKIIYKNLQYDLEPDPFLGLCCVSWKHSIFFWSCHQRWCWRYWKWYVTQPLDKKTFISMASRIGFSYLSGWHHVIRNHRCSCLRRRCGVHVPRVSCFVRS